MKRPQASPSSLRRRAAAAVLLASILPFPGLAGDFGSIGPIGLGLKTGESAGGFGAHIAYNFSPRWQASAGVGGASIPYVVEYGDVRTDSYFLIGKYYLRHLYFAAGYSHKRTRVEHLEGTLYRNAASVHGIPLHLGYEFGKREGFFFSTSIGFLYIPVGGGRRILSGPSLLYNHTTTARSGPSVGVSLGYYFRLPE